MTRVDASYDGSKASKVLIPKVHINGKKAIKTNDV
jgi:hypothetical protein